jgi:hypothetical protein
MLFCFTEYKFQIKKDAATFYYLVMLVGTYNCAEIKAFLVRGKLGVDSSHKGQWRCAEYGTWGLTL